MNKFVNSSHTVVHLLLFQTFFPSSFIETLPSYFLLALPWCLSFLCPFLRCLCSTVFSSWLPLLKASLYNYVSNTIYTYTDYFYIFISIQIHFNIFRQLSQLPIGCLKISLKLKKYLPSGTYYFCQILC